VCSALLHVWSEFLWCKSAHTAQPQPATFVHDYSPPVAVQRAAWLDSRPVLQTGVLALDPSLFQSHQHYRSIASASAALTELLYRELQLRGDVFERLVHGVASRTTRVNCSSGRGDDCGGQILQDLRPMVEYLPRRKAK
jgi:hypothetical protein